MDMGDVPGWIGAIATVVTAYAVVLAGRQLKMDSERRAEERERHQAEGERHAAEKERAERATAERVTAWAVSRFREDGSRGYGVVVRNDSQGPIMGLRLVPRLHDSLQRRIDCQLLPPGEHYFELGKNGLWDFAVHTGHIDDELRPYTTTPKYGIHELVFADSSQRQWRRASDGSLSRETSLVGPES